MGFSVQNPWLVDDFNRKLTTIYRNLTVNHMGILVDVTDKCWLMISWGIILPIIFGIIVIQERGIPTNQPGFNGMIEGF